VTDVPVAACQIVVTFAFVAARSRADHGPWPIVIGIGIVVVIAVIASVFEARRRKALAAFARRVGFSFNPGGAVPFDHDFAGYTPFGQGSSRRASNVITGTRGGVRFRMFDYRYTTGSGKNRRTHHYGIVAADVPLAFPRMTMRPEGMFDKIASLAGFDDLNFESEAFSRRYHVKCDDRKRVYDLVHPRMMEYLLSLPAVHWQLGPGLVLIVRGGRYSPTDLEHNMQMIEGFVERVPAYVRQELMT
jgi:hypothetical protein